MNTKGDLCLSRYPLQAIALYLTQQNWQCLDIRNRKHTRFHISNFWSHQSLGGKSQFFSPLGFDIQRNSDHETPKIKLYSVKALKSYLNDKNLIHGRLTAAISKFSPHIFDTQSNQKCVHRQVINLVVWSLSKV